MSGGSIMAVCIFSYAHSSQPHAVREPWETSLAASYLTLYALEAKLCCMDEVGPQLMVPVSWPPGHSFYRLHNAFILPDIRDILNKQDHQQNT